MQKVVICTGLGSSKTESANALRRQIPGADVLICSDASDIQRQLPRYEDRSPIMAMLQYYFGSHPGGSRGAQNWHPRFMDALDAELDSRHLGERPDIKTNVNQDTGSVFLVCPWSSQVEPGDVVNFTKAVESSFAHAGW